MSDVDSEQINSDYEFNEARNQYCHEATGKFVKKAVVEAAAEAKAKRIKMSDKYHKIRLPKWDAEDPELWFRLCEDTFFLAKCEEQEPKAILVFRELPQSVTTTVRQHITNLNKATRCDDLKKAILAQH